MNIQHSAELAREISATKSNQISPTDLVLSRTTSRRSPCLPLLSMRQGLVTRPVGIASNVADCSLHLVSGSNIFFIKINRLYRAVNDQAPFLCAKFRTPIPRLTERCGRTDFLTEDEEPGLWPLLKRGYKTHGAVYRTGH